MSDACLLRSDLEASGTANSGFGQSSRVATAAGEESGAGKDGGNVPGKSKFKCQEPTCGRVQDVLTSIRTSKKSGPIAAYAVQAYCQRCDKARLPYGQCLILANDWCIACCSEQSLRMKGFHGLVGNMYSEHFNNISVVMGRGHQRLGRLAEQAQRKLPTPCGTERGPGVLRLELSEIFGQLLRKRS